MKQLSVMFKPASALCNLRCKYCFYADISSMREVRSFGIMEPDTTEAILATIRKELDPGDVITLAFQGGEPTVAGLDYFRHFMDIVKQWEGIRVAYALQTNATLLDEEWCCFLKEHDVLVGVSLDLHKTSHDRARVDAQGQATYGRVMDAIHLLEKYGVEYNILCTLTSEVAQYPDKVWKAIVKNDFRYVQFTPCLDDLESGESSPYALTPERFASFYKQIFEYWLTDFKQGKYRSIKLFDDIVNLLACGQPTACGINGVCQPQLVVEADGSVYPCDFYCLDQYCLGNLKEDALSTLFARSMQSPSKIREPLTEVCSDCPYQRICGGGCKRMRREIFCGGKSGVCGYRELLDVSIRDLSLIAREEARYRS